MQLHHHMHIQLQQQFHQVHHPNMDHHNQHQDQTISILHWIKYIQLYLNWTYMYVKKYVSAYTNGVAITSEYFTIIKSIKSQTSLQFEMLAKFNLVPSK